MLALLTAAIENPDDREFMTQFYLEYERLMYATVRKRLTDLEAAKDIVQECVIQNLVFKAANALHKCQLCCLYS